jgi:hypothetical protein
MTKDEIEFLALNNKPIPYKDKTLLYPVLMENVFEFQKYISVLNIPKNDIDDVEIMRMSYLKFIIEISMQQGYEGLFDSLFRLMQLVLRDEYISFDITDKGKHIIRLSNGNFLTEFDFSKIRPIIAQQNDFELEDDDMNPELRKQMRETNAFLAKKNNSAPMMQRILSYQYVMQCDWDYIMSIPIMRFNRSLETISHIKQADLLQQALYGGTKEFKNPEKLPTWLTAIDKSKDGRVVDADELTKNFRQTFGDEAFK